MVNLYSDTQTRPSSAMRKAMAEAEVGDEQRMEDPQVTELCERVAALFGMEAAVFLPSGTMCNEIAFRLHIRPGGDEAILHRLSHPIIAEAGGPAAFAGAMMQPLDTPKGMFTGDDVRGALRYPDRYSPRSRLVSVEQSTNMAGGRVWPLEQLRGVVEVAKEHDLRLHMDGARLMNAVVASGVPAAEMAQGFDTAWLDFTKGLGAPLGACLAGSAELIEEAWRYKQMIGGALRQAGIVAAGALYALDHNVERLAEDHENAATLARGIAGDARRDARPGRGRDQHRHLRSRRSRSRRGGVAARRRADGGGGRAPDPGRDPFGCGRRRGTTCGAGRSESAHMKLEGIHHITAITGDAPRNVDFYVRLLGLRLVKKTVNQDDPTVYHLFYADENGSPGADLTFFEYPNARQGRAGAGMVHRIAHRVASADTLAFWEDRLGGEGVTTSRVDGALRFADPEGLEHELVVVDVPDPPLPARSTEVPDEHALLGFHAVDAAVLNARKTETLLRETLGFTDHGDGHWEARGEQRGGSIRLEAAGGRGFGGAGTIHHIAWATTFDEHSAWREHVAAAGYSITDGDRPLLLPLGVLP